MDHFATPEEPLRVKSHKLTIEEAADAIMKEANRLSHKHKSTESISTAEARVKDEIDELIAQYTRSDQGRNEAFGKVAGEVYESHSQRKKLEK